VVRYGRDDDEILYHTQTYPAPQSDSNLLLAGALVCFVRMWDGFLGVRIVCVAYVKVSMSTMSDVSKQIFLKDFQSLFV
jgi:hypothetical protein